MSKKLKYLAALLALGIIAIAGANYFLVQSSAQQVLGSDERNQGVSVFAHYQYFVDPSVLVIDLSKVSGTNSPADVTRVLLQFAKSQKSKRFELVKLAHQGKPKFMLKGEYFQTLGIEFGDQNPVYTMRTLPENVYNLDGTAAFGTWTGGMIGVLGNQMEDFNEFHKKWYIADLASNL
jgi:hypothetical protein